MTLYFLGCTAGKIKSLYTESIEAKSLADTDPLIAAEWDYEKNKPLTPDKVTRGSDDKYYWICPKCSRSYSASISHRTNDKTACPYCTKQKVISGINDLKTWCINNGQEMLLTEWDYNKNTDISPETVFKGANRKIWWHCSICGHEWEARLYSRTGKKKNGCPKCRERNRKYNSSIKVINLNTGEVFDSIKDAANRYGCTTVTISNNLKGRHKTAIGYHWDYYEEGVDYSKSEWYLKPPKDQSEWYLKQKK